MTQNTSDFMHALAAADAVDAENITATGSTVRASVPESDIEAATAVADDHDYELTASVGVAAPGERVRCRFDAVAELTL